MPLPAGLSEDLDLAGLLSELFQRLREVCPDCAVEIPEGDETELARRILSAVGRAESGDPTPAAPLPQAEEAAAALLDAEDPHALLVRDPRFASPLPTRLLVQRARELSRSKRAEAVRVASLAVRAADLVDPLLWGRSYTRETLLQARLAHAEALRAAGQVEDADRAVTEILGAVDPQVAARLRGDVHLLAGRLCRDSSDLRGAAAHLFKARDLYESVGDDARLGRSLLQLAEVYREHDQVDLAVETARQAVRRLEAVADPEAQLCARHNLAGYLVAAGRLVEARAELEGARALHGATPSPSVRLAGLWIEGRILEQLGDLAGAEGIYREVRDSFLDAGIALESALVALDLATVLVISGRYSEARDVATWLGLVIARHALSRPAHAATLLFREALGAEDPASEEILRHLVTVRAELGRG